MTEPKTAKAPGRSKTAPGKRPIGSHAKRGSFGPLVARIEQTRSGSDGVTLSSAAFRAGALVRMMRKSGKLSQAELAQKLSVSQSRISEIEAGLGSQGPTWSLMQRIAKACGSTILISPSQTDVAIDTAELPETARQWTLAAAEI